jgi:hypothetical protein
LTNANITGMKVKKQRRRKKHEPDSESDGERSDDPEVILRMQAINMARR